MAAAACTTAILVGAYYYAWYGIGEQWEVFPRTFEPSMGTYNSSEKFVMDTHHRQGKEACIQFFATSWGGDGIRSPKGIDPSQEVSGVCELVDEKGLHSEPRCTKDGERIELRRGRTYRVEGWDEPIQWWTPSYEIDEALKRNLNVENGVPMVLMYEIRDILGVGENQGQVDLSAGDNPKILMHHLLYAADHHLSHPNYFRLNGSPVLFLYTLRDFHNFVEPLSQAFRAVEKRLGVPLFIIGDAIWWLPAADKFPWRSYQRINVSALTAYNLYDPAQPEKMTAAFPWFSAGVYASFTSLADKFGIQVVPYVSPGYDDGKMRGQARPTLPRANGVSYLNSWYHASAVVSQQRAANFPALVMVNSFNEWHEGTQIEPSEEHGTSYLALTRALRNAYATWTDTAGQEAAMDADLDLLAPWVGRGEYGAGLPSAEEELELLGRHHVGWKEGVDVRTLSDVDGSTLEEDLEGARDEVERAAMEEAFMCVGRGPQAETVMRRLQSFPWPEYRQALRELCGYGGYETLVQMYYQMVLGRDADHAGLIHYARRLQLGDMTLQQLEDILLDSEEARARTTKLREDFFRARPLAETEVPGREELFDTIRRLYLKTLRRDPDDNAIRRFIWELGSGLILAEDLEQALASSEEAKIARRVRHKILYPGDRKSVV